MDTTTPGGGLQPPPPPGAKPLGLKTKYWALIILAAVATASGVLYWSKQPGPDLGPVAVHHKQTELKDWKTYINTKYGFEFKYPTVLREDSDQGGDKCSLVELTETPSTEAHKIQVASDQEGFGVFVACDGLTKTNINFFNTTYNGGYKQSSITVDGEKSYKHNFTTATGYTYVVVQIPLDEVHFIELSYTYKPHEGYAPLTTEQWDDILASFKFTSASTQKLETGSGDVCQKNSDCWCQNFTGAKFLPGKAESTCNQQDKQCVQCYYE